MNYLKIFEEIEIKRFTDLKGWTGRNNDTFGNLKNKGYISQKPLLDIIRKHGFDIVSLEPGKAHRGDAALPTEEYNKTHIIPFAISIGKVWTKEMVFNNWGIDDESEIDSESIQDFKNDLKRMGKPVEEGYSSDYIRFTAWLPMYSNDPDSMYELCLLYAKQELEIMKKSKTMNWNRGNLTRYTDEMGEYFKLRGQKIVKNPSTILENFARIDNRLHLNGKVLYEIDNNRYNDAKSMFREFSKVGEGRLIK